MFMRYQHTQIPNPRSRLIYLAGKCQITHKRSSESWAQRFGNQAIYLGILCYVCLRSKISFIHRPPSSTIWPSPFCLCCIMGVCIRLIKSFSRHDLGNLPPLTSYTFPFSPRRAHAFWGIVAIYAWTLALMMPLRVSASAANLEIPSRSFSTAICSSLKSKRKRDSSLM